MRGTTLSLLATLALAACTAPPPASDTGAGIELGTFGWLASIDVDVGTGGSGGGGGGGSSATLNESLGLEKAFPFRGELDRGAWAVLLDALYIEYGGSTRELGPLTTRVGIDAGVARLAAAREIGAWRGGAVTVEALGGVRFAHADVSLQPRAGSPTSADETWVDPVIGMRATALLHETLELELLADIGGFGVSSDLVWSARLLADWRPTPGFSVIGGYNALDYDFADDSLRFDVALHGPVLGLAFRF